MEVVLLFAMVIGLLAIGVPIAISLGLSSTLFLLAFSESSLASIAGTLFEAFEGHYTLLAIPFFVLASSFMTTGGVAKRIIRFSIACVGHLPGGLAIAGVFACMMFAALSGSSPATVVAIGTIVIAGMRQVGYTRDFAAGVICNAGTLGILIPPSIVMVVYAAAVEVSVGRMFLAGVIPGLLAGIMLMIAIYVMAKVKNLPKGEWMGWQEIMESMLEASWGLFLIIIILVGIYAGIFTPTEAAAVASIYAFLVAVFVYRDMGPLKKHQWLPANISRSALLGFRVWGFSFVVLVLYVVVAFIADVPIKYALYGAVFYIAIALLFGAVIAGAAQRGWHEKASLAFVFVFGVVPLVCGLIYLNTGGNSTVVRIAGTMVAFPFFLIPPALFAFAMNKGASELNEGSGSYANSLVQGGRQVLVENLRNIAMLIPSIFHRDTSNTLFEAGRLTVTLMFVIANALILKHVLTDEQIPQQIAGAMLQAGFGPIVFLIVVNVILLIGGQFMEPSGLLVIVAPLVFPIAIELGIDPIHLGIIMVVNMEIGMITPPVGLNLFVTSGVAGMPMMAVVRAALPFLAVLFVFLIMVTYIPWLSTVLPNSFMGPEIITR